MPIFPDIIVAGLAAVAEHWREISWFWFSALLAATVILAGGYAVLAIVTVSVIAVVIVVRTGWGVCVNTFERVVQRRRSN